MRKPSGAERWISYAALLAVCTGLGLAEAAGQLPTATAPQSLRLLLAAEERNLWLMQSEDRRTIVFRHGINTPLQPVEPLGASLAAVAAARDGLYAFATDGALYSLTNGRWSPGLNLPRRIRPVDLVGAGGELYALIASPAAGEMPRLDGGARAAKPPKFDPLDAAMSVVEHDSQGWIAVAPCPASVPVEGAPRLHPKLSVVRDEIWVYWAAADGRMRCLRLAPDTGTWRDGPAPPAIEHVAEVWLTTISRVPYLIVAVRGDGLGEDLRCFRLLGDGEPGADDWRPARLGLSELPAGAHAGVYTAAAGFNQHVALLMLDASGAGYVRFGRVDGAPAEPTIAVAAVLQARQREGLVINWVQPATLLVLFGMLLALFLFRRGAMVQTLALPPEYALAFAFQRLATCVIDLIPFIVVTAALRGVDWRAGLKELFNWAIGSDAMTGRLPPLSTLNWWGISSAACAAYCLVMELLTRRTLGKLLTGTHLVSETQVRAALWQIIVRNVFRFIELQPPFWVLGFVVVLSRNRQRIGDIFARTIVVRRFGTDRAAE